MQIHQNVLKIQRIRFIIRDISSPVTEMRLSELYKAQRKETDIDGKPCVLYGITDENGFYSDFTADKRCAESFAEFLNENGVEPCHVADIIEDFFYSCADKSNGFFAKIK